MKIERFEDMEVWKLTRKFVNDNYQITSIEKFKKDFDLIRRLRRASISISSNNTEGFERKFNNEFKHFLFISKAGEVRSQLYIARILVISGFIKYLNLIN